jgi:hypothetical protein
MPNGGLPMFEECPANGQLTKSGTQSRGLFGTTTLFSSVTLVSPGEMRACSVRVCRRGRQGVA